MANFNKSFNFRNGVQVDDDNFVVNPNGQVGIGSTIPTEFLDLVGNATVSGLTTTQTLFAGIGTVGVLTATHAGITTLAVDAIEIDGLTVRTIVGYHTIGWNIDYAYGGVEDAGGYGSGSGISTELKVGIGTTQAVGRYQLLIGQDPQIGINTDNVYEYGVGINYGNIHAVGIVTASEYFVGIGSLITQINAGNIQYGTISDDRLPDTITSNIVGDLTGTAQAATNLTGSPSIVITSANAGSVTANSIDVGVSSLSKANITDSVSGIATVTGILHVDGVGKLGIGSETPAVDLDIHKASPVVHVQSSTGEANLKVVADDDKANIDIISLNDDARIRFSNVVGAGNTSAMIKFGDGGSFDMINNDTGSIRFILDNTPAGVDTGSFSWKYGSTTNDNLMTLTYDGNLGIGETQPSEKLHVGGGLTVTQKSIFKGGIEFSGFCTSSIAGGYYFGDASQLSNVEQALPNPLPDFGLASDTNNSPVTKLNQLVISNQAVYNTAEALYEEELALHNAFPLVHALPDPFKGISGVSSVAIGHYNPVVDIDAPAAICAIRGVGINTVMDDQLKGGNVALRVEGLSEFRQVGLGVSATTFDVHIKNRIVLGDDVAQFYLTDGIVALGISAGPTDSNPGVLFLANKSTLFYADGAAEFGLADEKGRSILDFGSVGSASSLGTIILPNVTTAERNTIKNFRDSGNPVAGSIIFNSTTNKFQGYNGTTWVDLG